MKLRDARPGMAVVYIPWLGRREDGVVTSVAEQFVFVRFADQRPDAPGKACHPCDLELGPGEERR